MEPVVWISPQHTTADLVNATIDRKIEIFETQMNGWLLDHASFLAASPHPNGQHAGISILALCLVYVESIACFIAGETSDRHSGRFFAEGLRQIFPDYIPMIDAHADTFYREVRCGLIHQGMTRSRIGIIGGQEPAMVYHVSPQGDLGLLMINPWVFLSRCREHFRQYISNLRNAQNRTPRARFERWFDNRAF